MKPYITSILALVITISTTAQTSINYKTWQDKLNEEYCTGLFKSTDGTILDIASNPSASGYLNILDWLSGRVAGLQVFTNRQGVSIPVIRGQIPGIFVDEVQVSASYLEMLPIHDIALIKVIKTPFLGGFNSGGGAIAIYTILVEEEVED